MSDEATLLPAGGENAIAVTLGLMGDEWTLSILRYALRGVRRYQDWRAELPISDAVLSARLAELSRHGLLTREAYQERPTRYEYRLTERGRQIWPVLVSIWAWEYRWVADHAEQLPWMRHRLCGEPMEPVLTCAACEKPVRPRDVHSEVGPSGSYGRSIPSGNTRRRSGSGASALFPETMTLIGNRWSVAMLGAAFLGAHRFGEFRERLGAPPTMIADRLRTFCALHVLETTPNPARPDWATYRLTDKGRAFFPVIMTAIAWGQRWYHAPEGPALASAHTCGAPFEPMLTCDNCTRPLDEKDVLVVT